MASKAKAKERAASETENTREPVKAAKTAKKAARRAPVPKTRRGRGRRYSDAERQKILATAQREGLTGVEVSKRFGVSTLTYYLWRKKAGTGARRRPVRSGAPRQARPNGFDQDLRGAVRQQIQATLPAIIREEIERYLQEALGSPRRTR